MAASVCDRVAVGILVAEDEQAAGCEPTDHPAEVDRTRDLRKRQNAALFGRFDGIRADALEVHALNLRMPRHHRLQPRSPEFHRLLHHVIEAGMLDGSEQVVQIAGRALRPGRFGDFERICPLGCARQDRPPFAIAPVEDQDRIAGP